MGGSLDETAKTEALCQNKLNDRGSRILAMVLKVSMPVPYLLK